MEELNDIPGFVCIDHVAITTRPGELDAQVAMYVGLGFTLVHSEEVGGKDQVREALLRIGDGPNHIQLLEPLSDASPVARQIEKNNGRGGMAHVALRVLDVHAAFEHMKAQRYEIVDEAPRPGSRGTTVFFVHPRTLGYLIEIVGEEDVASR